MLETVHVDLLRRLREAAADDLARSYSATWSPGRLRTVLVHACLEAGHRVIESSVPGTPSHQARARVQARQGDLMVVPQRHVRALSLDLLMLASRDDNLAAARVAVRRGVERVSAGVVDVLFVAADADAYDGLRAGAATAPRRSGTGSALPSSDILSSGQPRIITSGEAALSVSATFVHAFGGARLACTAHAVPY